MRALINQGNKVTVVSRHWTGNEKGWDDYSKSDNRTIQLKEEPNLNVYYLPYNSNNDIKKNSIARKSTFINHFLKGVFHTETNALKAFKEFSRSICKNEKIDLIIVSSPPINLIRLAFELNAEFKIKCICDLRDLWDSNLLIRNKKFTLSQRIKNKLYAKFFRKWTSPNGIYISSVSERLSEILSNTNNKKCEIFYNGYEDLMLNEIKKFESKHFEFSSIGTMYEYYRTEVMTEGLKLFLKNKNSNTIRLNFIGLSAVPSVEKRIRKELPNAFLNITQRISKEEALQYLVSSQVLFHCAVREFEGAYTTKIFDYIGSGNNVLVAPGDNGGVIDALIQKTQAGKIARTPQEFADFLEHLYSQWIENKTIKYNGIKEQILFYSRSVQANRFVKYAFSCYEN